jgi:hypothetical protein
MDNKDLRKLIREAFEKSQKAKKNSKEKDKNLEENNPTTAPDKEKTKEKQKTQKPGMPGRSPKPGEKIKPKASLKTETVITLDKKFKKLYEQIRMRNLISEAPLRPEDEPTARRVIHPRIQSGLSGEQGSEETPFSGIEMFQKGEPDFKTISKLGTEEFNEVLRSAREAGLIHPMEMMNKVMLASMLEQRHREELERLALDTVQRAFGVDDNVMQHIEARLRPVGEGGMDMEDDSGEDLQDQLENVLEDDFTEEEQAIIKQYIDKRFMQNALMMGAGYRSHHTIRDLREQLNAIDAELFELYMEIMPNAELMTWQFDPKETGMRMNMGKSELIFDEGGNEEGGNEEGGNEEGQQGEQGGEEEQGNMDEVRDVAGARATAFLFPILLHEVAKSVVEYIFAYSIEQIPARMKKPVLSRTESYQEEHWMKLLGPRIWKYLHDAIDYIVHGRGDDYTIVSTLLYELSMLEPAEFLDLMDTVLHDGPQAIQRLEAILDDYQERLDRWEEENQGEEARPEDVAQGQNNMQDIARAVNDNAENLLQGLEERPEEVQAVNNVQNMSIEELNEALQNALENENYELAARVRDEINKRME